MRKTTQSLKLKVWQGVPGTYTLLLILLFFIPSLKGNAQTCTVMTTDFSEDFETAVGNASVPNSCWTRLTSGSYYSGEVNPWMSNTGSSSYFFYVEDGASVTLISPETDNLGSGEKQLRFYYNYDGGNDPSPVLEIYSMDDNTATATKTLLQSIPISSADLYTWKEYIIPLPETDDDYFAFSVTTSTPSGNWHYTYSYLDDIYYEDLWPCFFPMNIEVSDITMTEATISWDASLDPGATEYEYEIRTSGAPGSGTTGLVDSDTTTDTEVDITGLTAATNYTVYVRSICGTSTGEWTIYPINFMSACPVFGDFYEGFETTQLHNWGMVPPPNCWSVIYSNTQSFVGGVNWISQTGDRSLEVYRDAGIDDFMLVSPETDNLGNGEKRVRFSLLLDYYWPSAPSVEIYSLDGNTSSATKTLIETIVLSSSSDWEEYTVILPVTTDDYFAFSFPEVPNSGYAYMYLDDVYYEDIPEPALTTFIGNHNICFGGDIGTVTVEIADGAPPFTFEWLPSGQTTNVASGLESGIHTITVTDALNRSVTDTITITSPDELLSNIEYNDISCNGNADGSATINPSGGVAPYIVLWSTGDTGNTVSNLTAGTYSVTITDANDCEITEDFSIIEPDVLVVSAESQTNVSVYLGNDGSAMVDVTGGTLPYSYSWSPSGGTSDTASNLSAGTYTVTVTDAGGCTTDQTFVIIEPLPLTIHLVSQTNASCNGYNDGEVVVNVTGDYSPFTYVWTPPVGNGTTASNLVAGSYTLAVTDADGETKTETFVITEPNVLSVSVGSILNPSCNGYNNGSATATVLGGTAPYSYTWSNGETGATAVNLTAGNHFVYVTDVNGCQIQESFTMDQPSPILISTTSLTDVSCNGQADGTITISVNGGTTPYSYSWSSGQTGTSLSNLSGGNYIVTVTDGNGCTASKTFTIVDPAFVYPPTVLNQGFCSDSNPQLSDVVVTGSNIQWYDAVTSGNQLPATTALTNGTTYYASQTVNGCESNSRAAVLISLSTSVPLTTTVKDVCYNSIIQDVTIDGFDYTQLRWYSSATSTTTLASTTVLTSGTYYISSFTNNICESARQAVQVTVLSNIPAPTVTTQVLCGSGHTLNDLTVGQTTGTTLNWYTSALATTPIPGTTPALSGTYYVEQTIGSCTSVRVAVPVQIIPVTSPAMTSLTVCSGTTIADYNQQLPTKYVWYVDNTTTTPLAETTLITSGTFYIAEEISGCISNRAQVNVIVNQRPNSPTGQTVQNVPVGSTVANLQMNQPGVVWFASENEALIQTNQLSSNTVLIDGAKYYGILSAGTNCGSLPTEVTVEFTLSTNDLDLAYLKYYPNPTDSELNISYVETITKIEMFNVSGQRVLSKEFDANEVKVDLSGFGSGTYMVRIKTETASQFVKVVKK